MTATGSSPSSSCRVNVRLIMERETPRVVGKCLPFAYGVVSTKALALSSLKRNQAAIFG
jgi:hypothetical protein